MFLKSRRKSPPGFLYLAKKERMKIAEMFPEERPREKANKFGTDMLTLAELLAILIRTGTGKASAVEVARQLLTQADGSLIKLYGMSAEKICQTGGIGPAKAITLKAALELGKRLFLEDMTRADEAIVGPEGIFRRMFPRLRGLDHEECWAVFLNRSKRVIGEERLSSGGMSETTLDIPALVRMTLEKKAYAVILIHNHPSGDPHPGKADLELTRRAQLSLKVMGLVLLDHVIISDTAYFSLESETVYCTNAMISPFSNLSPCLPSTATMRPSIAETISSMP